MNAGAPLAGGWDAVQIAPGDHVAVALRDLTGSARVLAAGEVIVCPLPAPIPFGHKFALSDLPAGTRIRKYGEVIGVLTDAAARGAHLHVHNVASLRVGPGSEQ